MNLTAETREEMTVNIEQEIHVHASIETTFNAILEEIGPKNVNPEGQPMNLKIEAWPGGRWYRDLGDNNGHHWAHVQAIKRPTLLEFNGPLFLSFASVSNVQYRLSEVDGGTLIKFRHTAFGFIPEEYKTRMPNGWTRMHERVKSTAETGKKR